MIVKNEETILERCLSSIVDLMDEIIIIDTGSTDKTKEIAAKYTDKVFDFQWIDDFAAARNFSFSKATMDYIYTADADEVLDEENRLRFKQVKQVLLPEIEIVQMKYCNQLEHGTTYNFDEEYRPKLFKRLREFHWIDPIHETVDLETVIYDSDIEILHLPLEHHGDRDFEIFLKTIARGNRLSKKLHTMYARELFIVGTEQDFLQALDFFQASTTDETRSLDEVMEAMCVVARACRLKNDIPGFFKNCIKEIASMPCGEICYELGEYYYALGDFKEAIIWYYNGAYETGSILNIRYSGDLPLIKLAACYEKIGDHFQAEEYKRLAQEWRP